MSSNLPLAQVLATLAEHSLDDSQRAFLRPTSGLGQKDTKRQALRRALLHEKAGLPLPAGVRLHEERGGPRGSAGGSGEGSAWGLQGGPEGGAEEGSDEDSDEGSGGVGGGAGVGVGMEGVEDWEGGPVRGPERGLEGGESEGEDSEAELGAKAERALSEAEQQEELRKLAAEARKKLGLPGEHLSAKQQKRHRR